MHAAVNMHTYIIGSLYTCRFRTNQI